MRIAAMGLAAILTFPKDGQMILAAESNETGVDLTKAPALTITELLPDSSNMSGADAYEFIEIHNNTEMEINLKDYKVCYTYPDTGVVTSWWESNEDRILEAGENLIFWVKNGSNDSLTKEDFNNKFQTDIPESRIIEIECGGMANGSKRGMCICTNVGEIVDEIIYNDDTKNVKKDKSITYQNQYAEGSFFSVLTSDDAEPTPGKTVENDKPFYVADVVVPVNKPTVVNQTMETFRNDTEKLDFTVEAQADGTTVKTVKLYLKHNGQEVFECYKLLRGEENRYTKSLTNVDLLNKKNYTYYFEISDGFNTVTTEEKMVVNADITETASFNMKEGDTITGTQQIIAFGSELRIDGEDKKSESVNSVNGTGKIAFEATDTDVFFKNAVAVQGEPVGIFNEGTYNEVRTYVYDIDARMYDAEKKSIVVEFHAGNKANVLEHNIENNDDFTIRNIRMVLPNGRTLVPVSYQAKKGLGTVEHDNMDMAPLVDVDVESQESNISMGDGTSKYEILYASFRLEDSDFEATRYMWDTTQFADGEHTISNGTETITVRVDNTAPEIVTNIENQKEYHNGTIEVSVTDAISPNVTTVVQLDGKNIEVPYTFRSLEMTAGEHVLKITSRDEVGNIAEQEIVFTTPKESADIGEIVTPENGSTVTTNPILSVNVTDVSGDDMTVTFKKGEHYELADTNITADSGISGKSKSAEKAFEENSPNGFPYECFDILLDDNVDENTVIDVKWTGNSNSKKTFMYVYNTVICDWELVNAEQTVDGENMTLKGSVLLSEHLVEGKVKVLVQNGEGFAPGGTTDASAAACAQTWSMNVTSPTTPTYNVDDTPREAYDFTFVVESDTQYYNEDYDGNVDQDLDGVYQHQLNIHNWILANRERMNIQYMFHDGDIIDDEPNTREWELANEAYQLLDSSGLPYGILAGNHDVGHLGGDYTNFSTYFGEERYAYNPWYGESYKNNRGHYDLISTGGIDFIMLYMGWGIGDEEIAWMNEVLARYPERKAILNFHEYLLASGGLGEEPQRIHDEVVAKNENVCMVLSGHYHNAKTTIDTFTNADGTTRNVYNMLFDYQGLLEGGAGYLRLMHFDLEGEKIIIRTYTPSHGGSDINNYGDYDAKVSDVPNEGNDFVIEGANLNDSEHFEISFADLGITRKIKTLDTIGLDVNVYSNEVIGTVTNVHSGETASYEWNNAEQGICGWYAEVTDANGGLSRTGVRYVNVNKDTTAPELNIPTNHTFKEGEQVDVMEGVSALDNVDGDVTANIIVTGKVNSSVAGAYTLLYEVTDAAGNTTSIERTIIIEAVSQSTVGKTNNENVSNGSGNNGSALQNAGNVSGDVSKITQASENKKNKSNHVTANKGNNAEQSKDKKEITDTETDKVDAATDLETIEENNTPKSEAITDTKETKQAEYLNGDNEDADSKEAMNIGVVIGIIVVSGVIIIATVLSLLISKKRKDSDLDA